MYSMASVSEVDQHSSPRLSHSSLGSSQERAEVGKDSNPTTVLRRNSYGKDEVCDESLTSRQTKTRDRMVSFGELYPDTAGSHSKDTNTSFIRLPPVSLLDQYRRQSDPLVKYQAYKDTWHILQEALEQSEKKVRNEIRERMKSALPQPVPRPLPTPNPYVSPTENKRSSLRWSIRQDLAIGKIPRGSHS